MVANEEGKKKGDQVWGDDLIAMGGVLIYIARARPRDEKCGEEFIGLGGRFCVYVLDSSAKGEPVSKIFIDSL